MAPSWVRFGSFEIFYSRGDMDMVKKLADYVIDNVYTLDTNHGGDENKYARLVRAVAQRTAKMVAEWQAIGMVLFLLLCMATVVLTLFT